MLQDELEYPMLQLTSWLESLAGIVLQGLIWYRKEGRAQLLTDLIVKLGAKLVRLPNRTVLEAVRRLRQSC